MSRLLSIMCFSFIYVCFYIQARPRARDTSGHEMHSPLETAHATRGRPLSISLSITTARSTTIEGGGGLTLDVGIAHINAEPGYTDAICHATASAQVSTSIRLIHGQDHQLSRRLSSQVMASP